MLDDHSMSLLILFAFEGFVLEERVMEKQQGETIDATVKAVSIVFVMIITSLFIVIAVLSRRTRNKVQYSIIF